MPRAGQALRAPEVAPSTWGWEASDSRPVLTSKARQGAVTRVQGSDPHIPSSVHWSIRRTTQKQGRKWTVPRPALSKAGASRPLTQENGSGS